MTLDLTFKSQIEKVPEILNKIKLYLDEIDIVNPDLNFKVELCCRELLANAIEHGSQGDKQIIKIFLEIKGSLIIFKIKDSGPGFDWESLDLETMPGLTEKGRGLPLVNSIADKLEFNSSGNKITVYIK